MSNFETGSATAKAGFANELDVINTFNDWKNNITAKSWLKAMNYDIKEIEYVEAIKVSGSYKADVQVQIKISIKLRSELDCQNLQVKLVSNEKGFNQIDKRWIDSYKDLWDIPNNILNILKYYTGEKKPYIYNPKDPRRMFANELSENEQVEILEFLSKNKLLILCDILKGRGRFAAEWILVIRKFGDDWVLKPINYAINYYSDGDVKISPRGTFHIGRITMQRKGGDAGRDTAKMLQFKLDPTELFD